MTATLMTPAELAIELGTDARTTRKFLRSITPRDEQPGKGSRWGIKGTKSNIASLKKQFAAFAAAQEEAKAKRAAAKKATANEVDIEEGVRMLAEATGISLDELEGPSDADLAELDD